MNKYLKTKYGLELRNLLANKYSVDQIIDFFELPVFNAATDTAITKIINSQNKKDTKYFPIKTLSNLELNSITSGHFERVIKDSTEWKFVNNVQENILNEIYLSSISLKEFTGGKIFYGIKTGANHIFIIDESTKREIISY